MQRKLVKATIHNNDAPNVRTVWKIQWPSIQGVKWGKTYYATTYPDSDLIYLETAAKHRAVAAKQGGKIITQVRQAIERARAS